MGKERTQLIIIDHEKARLLTEVTPLYLNADLKQESPIPHGAGDSLCVPLCPSFDMEQEGLVA